MFTNHQDNRDVNFDETLKQKERDLIEVIRHVERMIEMSTNFPEERAKHILNRFNEEVKSF